MTFGRVVVALNGAVYFLTGIALLFAPQWFFDNIGTFAPFNRHYMGDLGGFLLALGGILLLALWMPAWQPGALAIAAVGGTLHALNHAVDAVRGTGGWDQTIALGILAAITVIATVQAPLGARRVDKASLPTVRA